MQNFPMLSSDSTKKNSFRRNVLLVNQRSMMIQTMLFEFVGAEQRSQLILMSYRLSYKFGGESEYNSFTSRSITLKVLVTFIIQLLRCLSVRIQTKTIRSL